MYKNSIVNIPLPFAMAVSDAIAVPEQAGEGKVELREVEPDTEGMIENSEENSEENSGIEESGTENSENIEEDEISTEEKPLSEEVPDSDMDMEQNVIMPEGMDVPMVTGEGMEQPKDPLLSSVTAIASISAVVFVLGAVIGILLAVKKIKKGFNLYED